MPCKIAYGPQVTKESSNETVRTSGKPLFGMVCIYSAKWRKFSRIQSDLRLRFQKRRSLTYPSILKSTLVFYELVIRHFFSHNTEGVGIWHSSLLDNKVHLSMPIFPQCFVLFFVHIYVIIGVKLYLLLLP